MTPTERAVANVGLAHTAARAAASAPLDEDDALGAAFLGLVQAAHGFDPAQGFKFSTYAVAAMNRVLKTARRKARLIPPPAYLWRSRAKLEKAAKRDDERGRVARTALANRDAAFAAGVVHSGWHGATATPFDVLGEGSADAASDAASDARLDTAVLLARLTDRQRLAVTLRFGLDGKGERYLSEVGAELGTTKEGARQILERALQRMRGEDAS